MKVLFFNPEQYLDFENEPSNYQCRLPILNCGLPIEPVDHVYQRDLRSDGREAMDRAALAAVDAARPERRGVFGDLGAREPVAARPRRHAPPRGAGRVGALGQLDRAHRRRGGNGLPTATFWWFATACTATSGAG